MKENIIIAILLTIDMLLAINTHIMYRIGRKRGYSEGKVDGLMAAKKIAFEAVVSVMRDQPGEHSGVVTLEVKP